MARKVPCEVCGLRISVPSGRPRYGGQEHVHDPERAEQEREYNRQRMREYNSRPEVRRHRSLYQREYASRLEVQARELVRSRAKDKETEKARKSTPEYRAARREYRKQPHIRARELAYRRNSLNLAGEPVRINDLPDELAAVARAIQEARRILRAKSRRSLGQ